ncbi:MAG: hypothetical protein ACYS0D_09260 [Planctomycetota bacterium]|jgi:hypothetical protein
MPVSWTTLFRLLVLLLVAQHVFNMYCFSRVVEESVGTETKAIVFSSFFALAMLIPLVWAVVLPDIPEIIRRQRARRRWTQGRCGSCGHLVIKADGGACPECGADRREPEPFRFSWATVRRFLALALGAWVLGSVAAESWIAYDERNFQREAETRLAGTRETVYTRPRRWPAVVPARVLNMKRARLYYTTAAGIAAFPPRGVLMEELAPHLPAPRPDESPLRDE